MTSTTKHKPVSAAKSGTKSKPNLLTRARSGDRPAYHRLFISHLSDLDRFIRHEIRYSETIGAVERGLIEPCAIIDQVYIAGQNTLSKMPKLTFRAWLRYLALHIMRQQVRAEHTQEPIGPSIERLLTPDADVDTNLWEFYQPDDVLQMEDLLADRSAADPESVLELQETEEEIEARINALPPEMRDILTMWLMDGLTMGEIAAKSGQTAEALRRSMQQACEALREIDGQTAPQTRATGS